MTRKLEELFDLPPTSKDQVDDAPEVDPAPPVEDFRTQLQTLDDTIDKIDAALPGVRGLESSDAEMDSLSKMATDSYDELMTLGMQVDSRFASEIFSVASNMLGHAITAKTAKLDKKLKTIDLQLKKMRLDQQQQIIDAKETENTPAAQVGQGVILSRNDLLDRIIGKGQNDTNA